MFNLEYYKVFYFVASCGSVTMAAEQLAISQPAVSQSVRQLEQALGIKLFKRTAKGVCLTTEGQVLFEYVAKGYEWIRQGERKLAQMKNLDQGEINIGASDMTLRFYLLPFLEQFHQQYPGIKVTVSNAPTPRTLEYLKQGKIDFGIVSSPFPSEKGIASRKVKEIEDVFVAGKAFSDCRDKQISFSMLEQLPLILLEKRTSTRSFLDSFLEKKKIRLKPEFELATSDMIVQFSARNLGIGFVVKDFAMEALEKGDLFALKLEQPLPKRHFCVVTKTDDILTAAAARLLEMMRQESDE